MIKNYYKKHEEIINYIVVGALTTLVSLSSYYLCTLTFLNPNNEIELQIANIISWICAVSFAYVSNRKYVFKSKNMKVFNEMFKFYSSRLTTLFLDMLFMFVLVSLVNLNDKISKIIVQILVLIINYIISKFIVFRKEVK